MTVQIRVSSQRAERCSDRFARRLMKVSFRSIVALTLVLLASAAAHAQSTVTVNWDRNTDSYTAGYRLYYGTAPGNYQWNLDAGNQTSAPVNLTRGSVYYMSVRAYNSRYEYGPPSSEATINLGTDQRSDRADSSDAAVGQHRARELANHQRDVGVDQRRLGRRHRLADGHGNGAHDVHDRRHWCRWCDGPGECHGVSDENTGAGRASLPDGRRCRPESDPELDPRSGWDARHRVLALRQHGFRGQNVIDGYSLGNVVTVSGTLPNGRYYARVRARNATGTSTSSNEVSFIVGKNLAAPTEFGVTWSGTTATLRWKAVAADSLEDTPTGYVIEAGSNPGLSDVGVANVGNVTSVSAEVSAGTYYVRVRSVNDLGTSHTTTDIALIAPGAPAAPAALVETSAAGEGTVRLRWTAPGGVAPLGYIVESGSEPGLSDIAKMQVASLTEFSTEAPPGTYYVRVRAVNERGAGPASNEIVVQR